jgi:hypothetical protein
LFVAFCGFYTPFAPLGFVCGVLRVLYTFRPAGLLDWQVWIFRTNLNFFRLPSPTTISASRQDIAARFIPGNGVSVPTIFGVGADLKSDEDFITPLPDTTVGGPPRKLTWFFVGKPVLSR